MNEYGKTAVRKIAISALLLAVEVVFNRVVAINTPIVKVGLGFSALVVCAMLYGPWWAAGVAALADIIGTLLVPTGAYFPGFTITAACTGIIFGLCLYNRKITWKSALTAAVLDCVLISYLANTAMIAIFFSQTAFSVLLAARTIQLAVKIPVYFIVIRAIGETPQIYSLIVKNREKKS